MPPGALQDDDIRRELTAILNSQTFAGSERLRNFLRFIVEQTLAGQASRVKEYTIGLEVFNRSGDYDQRIDPTVRVHAGKLRSKLREYYATERNAAQLHIDVPKGTYVPVFKAGRVAEAPRAEPALGWRNRANWAGIAAVLTVLCLVVAVLAIRRPLARSQSNEWVQLTNFADFATQPTLSADGRMLAFIRGPGTFVTKGQVYVKTLPGGDPVQLTHDAAPKMFPSFCPDGSRIAYTAAPGRRWDTFTVPSQRGEPKLLLANAEGMQWIGANHVLFSESKPVFT